MNIPPSLRRLKGFRYPRDVIILWSGLTTAMRRVPQTWKIFWRNTGSLTAERLFGFGWTGSVRI